MSCFWIFGHKWTKWEDIKSEDGSIRVIRTFEENGSRPITLDQLQERRCTVCNKHEIQRIRL